jgi:hypothetical protein
VRELEGFGHIVVADTDPGNTVAPALLETRTDHMRVSLGFDD